MARAYAEARQPPALLRGEGDVIAGGFSITLARQQLVDFSIPYRRRAQPAAVTGLVLGKRVPGVLERLEQRALSVARDRHQPVRASPRR